MTEYPKIQTVYLRDPATKFKTLLEGQWAKPEFAYLAECDWIATEKVDGTNIRVMWDGERVRFGGKTDDAQIHASLIEVLTEKFPAENMRAAFDAPACLYGEGYGAKIQKAGGRYNPTPEFILFDVKCGDWWLRPEDVRDVAIKVDCGIVPVMAAGWLVDLIDLARRGFKSHISVDRGLDAEGLVMRPAVPLFDRKGDRVIAKIKSRDFAAINAPVEVKP